ncbi:MAG: hypothetical protein GEU83_07930 [Pseudonocardiaceae bacterium]|nr:hypothetical protein [Pseudonocardiaceae bacterium]
MSATLAEARELSRLCVQGETDGGPPETGGYKGYGLAILADVLCGTLSDAGQAWMPRTGGLARGPTATSATSS